MKDTMKYTYDIKKKYQRLNGKELGKPENTRLLTY